MRILIVFLFCLCSAFASRMMPPSPGEHPVLTAAAPPHHGSDCSGGGHACHHDHDAGSDGQDGQPHPKLCPACFAIEGLGPALMNRVALSWRPSADDGPVLVAFSPEPLFPPPRA